MTLQILTLSSSWRDAKGFIGKTRYHITVDDTIGTPADVNNMAVSVNDAIAGLTNCEYAGSSLQLATPPTLAFGANAEYPAEWMKAVMTFTTDLTEISRFKIPAPELDLFDTDGVTILNDGTQAQVVAYINTIKTVVAGTWVSTKAGTPYTHFVGGVLKFGQQQKRHNQFIKSSHLVAGEGE